MGKVFTPEEIAFGEVPKIDAHFSAAAFIMSELIEGPRTVVPDIRGFLVYGSTVEGTSNRRSDIDTLLVYTESSSDVLDTVNKVVEEVRDTFHVPVEIGAVAMHDIEARATLYDPLLMKHLLRMEEISPFVYGNPATTLSQGLYPNAYSLDNMLATIRLYSARKTAKFARARSNNAYYDYSVMQRALELPKNLGRKVLGLIYQDPSLISADEIVDKFIALMDLLAYGEAVQHDVTSIAALATQLQTTDKLYSQLLELACEDPTIIGQYSEWIEGNRPTILTVAHELCLETTELLDLLNIDDIIDVDSNF